MKVYVVLFPINAHLTKVFTNRMEAKLYLLEFLPDAREEVDEDGDAKFYYSGTYANARILERSIQ